VKPREYEEPKQESASAVTKPEEAKQGTDETPPEMAVALVETPGPTPGSTGLAVTFEIEDGWHIYWTNPGDSGLATRVEFSAIDGAKFTALRYPLPERFIAPGDITSFGYGHRTALFSSVRGAEKGQLISAKASWLVCKSTCIKQKAELSVILGETTTTEFETLRKRLPLKLDEAGAPKVAAEWTTDPRGVGLTLTFGDTRPFDFFPEASDPYILDSEKLGETSLELHWRRAAPTPPSGPQGLLVFGTREKPRAYTLDLPWPDPST
jgi:hypothetical protein